MFEKKYDVKVKMTPQVDPIQSANMVKADPGRFDVVIFGIADTPFLYDDLAKELDLDRVKEAWEAQYPFFRKMWDPKVFAPASFGGKPYSLATQWGSSVLAWNTKRVKETPKSWTIMGDPKYKDRTSFIDQAAEMYGTMSLTLGRSANDLSDQTLKDTDELAGRWLDNAKTLWSTGDDIKQLMAQEEVWISYLWDGTARQLMKEGYPIDYAYPDEGVRGWVDGAGIMRTAKNVDEAYDFLNFALSKEFGVAMSEDTLYASGNQAVAAELSEKTREIMRIEEMGKLLNAGKMYPQKLQGDDFEVVDKWWRELKLKHQA
ncbi:MAG: extracellular solute-binding protein [Nocardioidaceae bacterium]